MWWYGRGYSDGSWIPEGKKANMWPGRGNMVAHGRLPFPAPTIPYVHDNLFLWALENLLLEF